MSQHRRRIRRRTAASALVAAALVVAASACSAAGGGTEGVATGPGTGSTTDVAFLHQAAAATGEATTLGFSLETSITGLSGVGDLSNRVTGEIDRQAHRAHLTTDLGGVLGELAGAEAGDGSVELVLDGDTAYLRSPLYTRLAGSDRPWLSVSAEDLADLGSPGGGGQADPTDLLGFLEGAGGELTELGHEEVRGVDTRHVSTEIDLKGLLAKVDDDRRQVLQEALDRLGGDPDALVTIPAEAWVDADGHVRRFTLTFDFSKGAAELPGLGDVAITSTYDLYDLDEPVDIAVPDPADVAPLDVPKLLGGN